nr:protein QUIRKY isoform X1 [Ipomoea trifida]
MVADQIRYRKLIAEICNAKNLMPKDGQGTASAYVLVDFDGQRRRTTTKFRDGTSVDEGSGLVLSDSNPFMVAVDLVANQDSRSQIFTVRSQLDANVVFSGMLP